MARVRRRDDYGGDEIGVGLFVTDFIFPGWIFRFVENSKCGRIYLVGARVD